MEKLDKNVKLIELEQKSAAKTCIQLNSMAETAFDVFTNIRIVKAIRMNGFTHLTTIFTENEIIEIHWNYDSMLNQPNHINIKMSHLTGNDKKNNSFIYLSKLINLQCMVESYMMKPSHTFVIVFVSNKFSRRIHIVNEFIWH